MKWFVTRARYDDLHARYQDALERIEELAKELTDEQDARRLIACQYVDADTAARRVHARNQRLLEQLEDAREAQQQHAGTRPLTARLNRALRACARYRIQVAARERMIRTQQKQLDAALGLNEPEITAGANWQKRRVDKQPWGAAL